MSHFGPSRSVMRNIPLILMISLLSMPLACWSKPDAEIGDYIHAPPAATPSELAPIIKKANAGDVHAAKGLFTYYCVDEDNQATLCDYWKMKAAMLGDNELRCGVLYQYDANKKMNSLGYRQHMDNSDYRRKIAILRKRGRCPL